MGSGFFLKSCEMLSSNEVITVLKSKFPVNIAINAKRIFSFLFLGYLARFDRKWKAWYNRS